MIQLIRILAVSSCILFTLIGCAQSNPVVRVNVKDLVASPDKYNGKTVQVDGCMMIGFEWQDLFPCDTSGRRNRIWLELGLDYSGKKLKDTGMKMRPVVLIGEFHTGIRYGHENGYTFELGVLRVVSVGPKQNIPITRTEN